MSRRYILSLLFMLSGARKSHDTKAVATSS